MKIKKAILTGGGRATRLHPITTTINKHLLPLANKPMIFHAIEKVVAAGITEIFINVNPGEIELQKYIGDGGHWGVSITFFEQTGGPQGIAHVVKEAEKFIGGDPFIFYLSDNILFGDIGEMVEEFHKERYDCMLALSKVKDPQRFGVPIFDADGTLIDVHEKPETPPNDFAVTGIYLYGPKVFFDAFEHIEKSARGEYEISSIHSHFLKQGKRVGYKEITGWWKDTGKTDDLLVASRLLLDRLEARPMPRGVDIDPSARIDGVVHLGVGTRIGKGVTVKGPAIVGQNCILENCTIGPYATIGAGSEVRGATVQHSILLENGVVNADINIVDSLLGKNVTLRRKDGREAAGHRMIIGDKTVLEF